MNVAESDQPTSKYIFVLVNETVSSVFDPDKDIQTHKQHTSNPVF